MSLLIGNTAVFRDHPRSCGEYRLSEPLYFEGEGSSPLMRGVLTDEEQAFINTGIIPAHAGSMQLAGYSRYRTRDHPRSCGEY